MGKKVTIKDIAKQAGVSIATVSHVINHTRYVSPELIEKVEKCMKESGYEEKIAKKTKGLRMGKDACIIGVFPNWNSIVYQKMMSKLRNIAAEEGYLFCAMCSENSVENETQILLHLQMDRTVAGIFFVPLCDSEKHYKELLRADIPMVFLEQSVAVGNADAIVFEYRNAMTEGMNYLVECGHENIVFFRDNADVTSIQEQTEGYMDALASVNYNMNDGNIIDINLEWGEDKIQKTMQKNLKRIMPTAVISGGNRITSQLLKVIRNMGLRIPEEISIVGFGDEEWIHMVDPRLTVLKRDISGLCRLAGDKLFDKIRNPNTMSQIYFANIELQIGNSTRMLDNGHYGEKPVSPEKVQLSSEEKKKLRMGKYRVAISFHYTETAWAEMHEAGIRDELDQYGIEIISVMDAHFDADLQNKQLESIRIQKPDAVIAIPTDDRKTADAFQTLSMVTKLVFISNIPEGIGKNSYVSCISVNEYENGANVGRMMGNYFKGRKPAKVAFIVHGATFSGTRVRDNAARKILTEQFPEIEIVANKGFGTIENAYQQCKEIIKANPEVEGLYVSWDRPALQAIRALKEMEREDIAVFTTDLDTEIANCMEKGIVKGMSTQRPYEQGRAVALAVEKTLLGEEVPKYIGVQPYTVEPQGLNRAWRDVFHKHV